MSHVTQNRTDPLRQVSRCQLFIIFIILIIRSAVTIFGQNQVSQRGESPIASNHNHTHCGHQAVMEAWLSSTSLTSFSSDMTIWTRAKSGGIFGYKCYASLGNFWGIWKSRRHSKEESDFPTKKI